MTAQHEIVDALQEKVARVIEVARRSSEENAALQRQVQMLSETVKEKDLEIAALQERFQRLKLARALTGTDESARDARQQIGKIVREIDKCISLLNR